MSVLVVGKFLGVENKKGVSSRTGNPYSMTTASVLIGPGQVAQVTLEDEALSAGFPGELQTVAYECTGRVTSFNGVPQFSGRRRAVELETGELPSAQVGSTPFAQEALVPAPRGSEES